MVASGSLSDDQAQNVRSSIRAWARENMSEEFDKGRWQSRTARWLSDHGADIAQQTLSKFLLGGTMSEGTARSILAALGEDPNDVLGTGPALDETDMSPTRARVLFRNRHFFPEEVLAQVRALPLDGGRDKWDAAAWVAELVAANTRWVMSQRTSGH